MLKHGQALLGLLGIGQLLLNAGVYRTCQRAVGPCIVQLLPENVRLVAQRLYRGLGCHQLPPQLAHLLLQLGHLEPLLLVVV